MGKRIYGQSNLAYSNLTVSDWSDIAHKSIGVRKFVGKRGNKIRQSIVDTASSILGQQFDPGEYVLSHNTIVSAVTVYAPKNPNNNSGINLGKTAFDPRIFASSFGSSGFKPVRKYPDFRVTRDTQKFINGNFDAFSRGVLTKSYLTFIGAHNFVEHIQVEALSKGRILDVALRNIGPTLYVDILVATHKFHEKLCEGILDGSINKMSMGCDALFTQCTCCGHWSADDTDLCPCIQNFKGMCFTDEDGQESLIAELCGHESVDPTGGVFFKEASWVETPAFEGAVNNKILNSPESEGPKKVASKPKVGPWVGGAPRTAHARTAEDEFDVMEDLPPGEEESEASADKPPVAPLDSAIEELQSYIYQQALSRIRDQVSKRDVGDAISGAPDDNDNLSKLATQPDLKFRALVAFAKASPNQGQFIQGLPLFVSHMGGKMSKRFANAIGKSAYLLHEGRGRDFIVRCGLNVGRCLSRQEAEMAIRVARLLGNVHKNQ